MLDQNRRQRHGVVKNTQAFGTNCARALLGKNVNLHLKDGSVIVNVQLENIQKDEYNKQTLLTFTPYRNHNPKKIPLKTIAWAELLNLTLIKNT